MPEMELVHSRPFVTMTCESFLLLGVSAYLLLMHTGRFDLSLDRVLKSLQLRFHSLTKVTIHSYPVLYTVGF